MPGQNQPACEAFKRALESHMEQLSADDKLAFGSASDVMLKINEMNRSPGKIPLNSTLAGRVQKILGCVRQFMSSISIFIQHSPEISSLVVGGVNCVLKVRIPRFLD